MGDKKGGLVWLWVLLGVGALAVVGYGWYKHAQPKTGEELAVVDVSTSEKSPGKASSETQRKPHDPTAETLKAGDETTDDTQPSDAHFTEKDTPLKPQPTGNLVEYQFEPREKIPVFENAPGQKDLKKTADVRERRFCTLINQHVMDFFQYLDRKKDIQQLNLGETTYARFKRIIEQLVSRPPIPAGEGIDPAIMIKNIYFFCRALDKKDLDLITRVAAMDQDTLEDNMGMFNQWLMLGNRCENPGNVRPSFEVLYRYAGFFLNTTGGRAYMFRRGLKIRLLVTYYSVQIIYQADRAGKNSYGINVLPYMKPLMEEMRNYPDLLYKEKYLETLTKIRAFYSGRR